MSVPRREQSLLLCGNEATSIRGASRDGDSGTDGFSAEQGTGTVRLAAEALVHNSILAGPEF